VTNKTNPTPIERRLFPVDDAAYYLGISRRQVYKLVEAGEIPKVPIGSRSMFDRVDLDAYIERIKTAAS